MSKESVTNGHDLISRHAVALALDRIKMRGDETWYDYYHKALDAIAKLPSEQPERKKGHWIYYNNGIEEYYECSACGNAFVLIEGSPKENDYNFCPNCGADMREVDDEIPD